MALFNIKRKARNNPLAMTAEDTARTLHENLDFTSTEQYKMLRTNLSFTLPDDVKCPVIGVTSSMRGEGKSTTSINLAYALAQTGKKVALIDGDLRLPSIARKMQLPGAPGLTNLLLNYEGNDIDQFKSTLSPKWYIIPAGELPPNPSELLGSRKMTRLLQVFSQNFDYIIIDLPPINVVPDAMTISKHLTGLVLVVRENYTTKSELAACVRQLKLSNVNVLGYVMNGMRQSGGGKYGKYGKYDKYGKYGKYYSNDYKKPAETEGVSEDPANKTKK